MDASSGIDELRTALTGGAGVSSMAADDRFIAAIDEIQRRGPEAAPLVPELVALLDDTTNVYVPNPRAPAEVESDVEPVAKADLARRALAAIGPAAVTHLLDAYRAGKRSAHFAGAIASTGEAGLAATLAILREVENVRTRLLFNLSMYGLRQLQGPRFDKLRPLVRTNLAPKECADLMLELERVIAERSR